MRDPALEATLWGLATDPDNDSQTNEEEYGANTDPRDAASRATPEVGEEEIALYYRFRFEVDEPQP